MIFHDNANRRSFLESDKYFAENRSDLQTFCDFATKRLQFRLGLTSAGESTRSRTRELVHQGRF